MTLEPTALCTSGYAPESLYEHGESLIDLHRAGTLRLIDSGRDGDVQRWRVSYGSGDSTVRAVLGVADTATDAGEVTFWVYAETNRPWSIRDQENPVQRMGLHDYGLKDPSAGFSLCEWNPLLELTDVNFLAHIFNGGVRETPVVVYNDAATARFNREMRRFRNATRGLCGLLPIDDSARERLNELLPAGRRVPYRGVRLYLPPWWVPHADDIIVEWERLSQPAEWRRIVEMVFRVNRWRAGGKVPRVGAAWHAALFDPMASDVRVAPGTRGGEIRWLPAADGDGENALRRRLGETTEQERKAKADVAAASARLAEKSAAADDVSAKLRLARDSRARLAALAQRLRTQRDRAEDGLNPASIKRSWREAHEAQLEAALYAEELDEADAAVYRLQQVLAEATPVVDNSAPFNSLPELVAAARDLPGLRFGPKVAVRAAQLDHDQRSARWRRRVWEILQLLSEYAETRRIDVGGSAPELRGFAHYVRARGGLNPALVATGETEIVTNTPRYRETRTFPVPTQVHESGRAFFGAHVKVDKGGGTAPRLHFLDDTWGPTEVVHIGYLGPHLPGPETN